jgi:hypothetical protein
VDKAWPGYMNDQCKFCCTILAALHKFEVFVSEALIIAASKGPGGAFGAIKYLLEQKEVWDEKSAGLFYCLIIYSCQFAQQD